MWQQGVMKMAVVVDVVGVLALLQEITARVWAYLWLRLGLSDGCCELRARHAPP